VDAWALAAAILIEYGQPMHIGALTSSVLDTGQSRLGLQGGKTTTATLGANLRKKLGIFDRFENGFYYTKSNAKKDAKVGGAIAWLSSKRQLSEKSAILVFTKSESLETILSDIEVETGGYAAIEGGRRSRFVDTYERSPKLRAQAVAHHGTKCAACDFDFRKFYGALGDRYIEVHHNKPLGLSVGPVRVDAVKDMDVVCANCHRMLHRHKNKLLSVKELRILIKEVAGKIS
jgi:predicted HNH restriction endonuclease